MKRISLNKVLQLYKRMIDATGGSSGIRDMGLLDSALSNAYATFDGVELYPTVEQKCSSICYSIINNHPLVDGNKRMGIFIMLILLELNNIKLKYSQAELIDLGLGIAKGLYKQDFILEWIMLHSNT
jgi:death-on-curing protein